MEDVMKRSAILFASFLTAAIASPVSGQTAGTAAGGPAGYRFSPAEVVRIEKNYVAGLRNMNDGVVESAVANGVRMRWALPASHLDGLRENLAVLSSEGRTPAIRFKAYLAGLVYDSPSMFAPESAKKYTWDDDLFAAIGSRAEKALLGYNSGAPHGF
jgi:hypothetical protein